MYSCSRQVSQGEQRSYSANQTPLPNFNEYQNDFHLNTPMLKRSCGYCFKDDFIHEEEIIDDQFHLSFISDDIKENDHDEKYKVSDQIDDNPYSNLSILSLMRSCSSNIYDNKLFR